MIGETVTVVRPGSKTDGHGNVVADWDDPTETDVAGCAVAPALTPEDRGGGRQGVVAMRTVYMPAGVDVEATDRLVVRGETYEIDGEPGEWVNPYRAAEVGIEISVRRVAG